MVEEVIHNIVKKALTKVNEKEGLPPNATEADLDNAVKKTVAGINRKAQKNLKHYEDLLEKYLAIPDYVILPDDKKHDVVKYSPVSEADMINTKIQSQALEAEVTEVKEELKLLN